MEQEDDGYFVHRVKYKQYFNATQTKMLERHFGLCRRLYNMMLETSLSNLANELPKNSVFDLNHRMKEISDTDPEPKEGAVQHLPLRHLVQDTSGHEEMHL